MSINSTEREVTVAAGAVGATEWVRITEGLAVQVTGAATAVSVVVERSTRDPEGEAGPNTAAVETMTGSAAAGIAPRAFDEPGSAWWRARASNVAGGGVLIAVTGRWGG